METLLYTFTPSILALFLIFFLDRNREPIITVLIILFAGFLLCLPAGLLNTYLPPIIGLGEDDACTRTLHWNSQIAQILKILAFVFFIWFCRPGHQEASQRHPRAGGIEWERILAQLELPGLACFMPLSIFFWPQPQCLCGAETLAQRHCLSPPRDTVTVAQNSIGITQIGP